TAETLRVTAGGAWGVLADRVTLDQSAAQLVAARDRVDLDQAAAGIVAGGCVNVRGSAVGLLVTGHFEGQGGRGLLGPHAAFALGAGAALVLSLFGLWRRRA